MRGQDLVGKTVVGVRRMLYVYQGTVGDEGPLELTFEDGSIARFETTANGEMQVTSEPWIDHFAPPLSPENAAYVRQYGKWTVFDRTSEPPAYALIGRQVSSYEEDVTGAEYFADYHFSPYQCPPGHCLAASIAFGDVVVRVLTWGADEIHVDWQGTDLTVSDQSKRG